jgi:hypothetical protein
LEFDMLDEPEPWSSEIYPSPTSSRFGKPFSGS